MVEKKIRVETYNLKTKNGKHIRKATMVIFPDGITIRFMEKMGKREAIRQAQEQRKINKK